MKLGRLQLNCRIGVPLKLGRLQLNRRIGAPATNRRDGGHPQELKMPQFVFYCFIHEAAAIRPPRSTTMATPFNRPALRPRGSPALRLAMTNGAPLRPSMPTVAARTPASAGALPLCPGDATKPAPEVSLWWTPRSTGRVLSALASRSVSSFSLLLPLSYVALL
jgi:hypothetical protein